MTLNVIVDFERRTEVIKLFSLYVGPVLVKQGCMGARLYADCSDAGDYMIFERWQSAKHLQKHIRSRDYQRILDIIDLAKEPPEIKFHSVPSVEGFELVQGARKNIAYGGL
ncbi:MAG TPA: antibiotic biosynthesis monooxygenase [Syntrophorhabdaceae bacterium]|nr:antibiotic biosynthesis monooxygenase [Syntrophorhabdaceae bacterium]